MDAVWNVTINLDSLVAWRGLLRSLDDTFGGNVSRLRVGVFVLPLALESVEMDIELLSLLLAGSLALLECFVLGNDYFLGFFIKISLRHVQSLSGLHEVALIE